MSKLVNIITVSVMMLAILLFAIVVVISYSQEVLIFGPYHQPPPGPSDEVFRPGGQPIPLTDEEIKARQAIAAGKPICNRNP